MVYDIIYAQKQIKLAKELNRWQRTDAIDDCLQRALDALERVIERCPHDDVPLDASEPVG